MQPRARGPRKQQAPTAHAAEKPSSEKTGQADRSTDSDRARDLVRRAASQPDTREFVLRAPWCGHTVMAHEPTAAAAAPDVSPRAASVRVCGPVDRRVGLLAQAVDVPAKDENGRLVAILRRPIGYPSGPLPGDPSRFDPPPACAALPPMAALRCLVGGR